MLSFVFCIICDVAYIKKVGGTLLKLHVSHFITVILVHVLYLYFDYVLTNRLIPTFSRQNPSLSKNLFQEIINKMTKIMANIDHCHSNKIRHM